MYVIELVKGMSYTDGKITASKKSPRVEVDSLETANHYVKKGFFKLAEITESDQKAAGEENTEETTDAEEPEADALEEKLSGMTVKELQTYAEKNGIDLTGCKTKADMVAAIVEAEENAKAVRAALREE